MSVEDALRISGMKRVVTLPNIAPIIEMEVSEEDDHDLIIKTSDGMTFRIDTKNCVIKAN